jgi:O-antigen/teichoic acid export membrane protein
MRKSEAIRGFGWNLFFTVLNKVLLPFVGFFLAGKIGPAGMGLYFVINSLYVIVELFRDAGLALTYAADQKADDEKEATYFSLAILSGLSFGALIFLGRDGFATLLNAPIIADALPLTALGMVLTGFGTISINRLYKQGKFFQTGAIDTAANLFGYVIAFFLVYRGFGYLALVWQMFSRSLAHVLMAIALSPPKVGKLNRTHARDILKLAQANLWANAAYTVYTMGDYLVVKRFFGETATGLYGGAYNIGNKPVDLVSGPLTRTIFVALSRASDDPDRFGRIFVRALNLAILVTVPLYFLLAAHPSAILHILYFGNDKFQPAAPYLTVLCLYLGMRALGTVAGNALVASGRPGLTALAWIAAYLVAIPGVWYGISQNELMLIVISLTAGAVVVYSLYLIAAFRTFKPNAEAVSMLRRAVMLAVIGGTVAATPAFFGLERLTALAIGAGVSVPLYLVLIGKTYLGSPKRLLSKSGLKELIERL